MPSTNPPTSQVQEILNLTVNMDVKGVLKEAERFQRGMSKGMKKIQEATAEAEKGSERYKKLIEGTRFKARGIKELTDQWKALDTAVRTAEDSIEAAREKVRQTKAGTQERKDAVQGLRRAVKGSNVIDLRAARAKAKEAEKDFTKTGKKHGVQETFDAAEKAGEEMAKPLRMLFSKDLPGIMKATTNKLLKWGIETSAKQAAAGAGGGGAAAAGGGLTKALGGLAQIITKIGPLLHLASSFTLGFVKMLLDAEAGAKEYNKQILAVTGTQHYLTKSMGNARKATDALDDSVTAAREGANHYSNLLWGISEDTARAFQQAVTQEGVALDRLGQATRDATAEAEIHAATIQMGVAYSRAFGVSLNEIGQLQGQLMADLGFGLDQVNAGFQTIADGAAEAGMETNKFFGVIRNFASDLSLFTLRLADLSKIAGVLGKTMDPRKMGEAIKMLTDKFTGGLQENLKLTVMGGKGFEQVQRKEADAQLKILEDMLREKLGPGAETDKDMTELLALLKNPKRNPQKIAQWIAKNDSKLSQKDRDAIKDQMIFQSRMLGSVIDRASVAGMSGPIAKYAQAQAISQEQFHARLEDLGDKELLAIEATGVASMEQLKVYHELNLGVKIGQEQLIARIGDMTQNVSDADKAMLERLKIDAGLSRDKQIEALRKVFGEEGGDIAYLEALSKDEQELLLAAEEAKDYQKETSNYQVSIEDKIKIIADMLSNWIYKALTGILSLLGKLWAKFSPLAADDREFQRAEEAALKTRNLDMQKILESSDGDLKAAKEQVRQTLAPKAIKGIEVALKQYAEVQEKLAKETDPEKKKKLQGRLKELEPAKQYEALTKGSGNAFDYLIDKDLGKALTELNKVLAAGAKPAPAPAQEKKGAPASPGAAPATGAKPAAPAPVTAAAPAAVDAAKESSKEVVAATQEQGRQTQQALTSEGIKIAPATIAGPLKDSMAKSVYEGTAKALFEYYMYQNLDRASVATALSGGVAPGQIAQGMTSGKAPQQVLSELLTAADEAKRAASQPHARGGLVTGIANGMAQIAPAPGEGLASVGRGERIVPAGGGGGGGVRVQLEFNGDFKRFINARVVDGAAAHDRNKRLR